MSSVTVQPLSALSPSAPTVVVDGSGYKQGGSNWVTGLIWFIILVVIIWLILYSIKPSWVLVPGTQNVDSGKLLFGSIIVAIIVLIIIWVIKALVGANRSGGAWC